MNDKQLEEINIRIEKLEKQGYQDLISLLEIMSNATFFGKMKKTNCEYAKEGQCNFFFLKKEAKNKLPIAMDCRINDCKDNPDHCHLELSALTCTLCPIWRNPKHSTPVLNSHKDTGQTQNEHSLLK